MAEVGELTPTLAAICAYASSSLAPERHRPPARTRDGPPGGPGRRDQPRGRAGRRDRGRPDHHAATAPRRTDSLLRGSPHGDLRGDPGPHHPRHHGRRHRVHLQDAAHLRGHVAGLVGDGGQGSTDAEGSTDAGGSDGGQAHADGHGTVQAAPASPIEEEQ